MSLAGSVDLVHFSLKMLKIEVFGHFFIEKNFFQKKVFVHRLEKFISDFLSYHPNFSDE